MRSVSAQAALLVGFTVAALLWSEAQAVASIGPRVNGGGVVGGPLGVTSQLGINASSVGGTFLCIMAGRSGGFPFGPWSTVLQMQVQGDVSAGTLSITGSSSRFEGTATVHVVGKTASGDVQTATFTGVRYVSAQGAGGAGTAWHRLQIAAFGIDTGASSLTAGHIAIAP